MIIGGIVGLIVVIVSILIIVGAIGLTNLVVGGLFLVLGIGMFGPAYDTYGRRVV